MIKLPGRSLLTAALLGTLSLGALPTAMADDNEYEKQFRRDDDKHDRERKDDDKYDSDHRIYSKSYWVTIKNVRDPCNKKKIDVLGKSTVTIRAAKDKKVIVTYKFETPKWSKWDVDLRGQKKFDRPDWQGYIVPIYGSFEKDHDRDASEFDAKGYAKVFAKHNAHYEPRGEHIFIRKVRCDDDKKYDHEGDKDNDHGHGKGGDDY